MHARTLLLAAGVPFRETHHISGAAVKLAEDRGCQLSELSVGDLQGIHPLFGDDVTAVGAGCMRPALSLGLCGPSRLAHACARLAQNVRHTPALAAAGVGLQSLRGDAGHGGRRQQALRAGAGGQAAQLPGGQRVTGCSCASGGGQANAVRGTG